MNATNIRATFEARQSAVADLRALADRAAGRHFTADEQQTEDRLNAAIDDYDERIRNGLAAIETEARKDAARQPFEGFVRGTHAARRDPALAAFLNGEAGTYDVDLRGMERRILPNGAIETRDLTVGTASAGGDTVPTSFRSQLVEHLVASSAIRRTNATILTTDSGEKIEIPKTTGYGTAVLTAEGVALSESDPTFGQAELDSYKYGVFIEVSNELLSDSGIDIEGFLAREVGIAIGNATGPAYITGTGTSQPQGVVGASSAGVTAAAVAAVTTDELIDLFFSVTDVYRANGFWLMKDSTLQAIRKLKDGDSNYVFERSLSRGVPDTLLGRPIVTDPNMPALGTGNKSILFGDFSRFYIRDVQGIRFESSTDFAFDRDVTAFRAVLRTDSELVDRTGAIKHLVHP